MSSERRALASPELLDAAAGFVIEAARREGVRAAVIGGLAMQAHGSDRLTADVDIAADALIASLPRGKALSFGGEETSAPNGIPVDVVVRTDDYAALYAEAIAEATTLRGLPVVGTEHLVAMKLAAGRPKHIADLEVLVLREATDLVRAEAIVRKHLGPYAARELRAFAEEARWRRDRGR
ncbi:MAG: hypothetical protein HY908_28700 [Myxococcales bacterium]|nr:hypothetical protein [Myxococcales bacterium]